MLKDKMKRRIRDYCDKQYPAKLDIVQNDDHRPLFNNRCQWNADALVRQGKAVAIVECVVLWDDSATLHYVCLGPDMKVFDATLGPIYTGSDYRLISVIRDFPNNDPDEKLRNMKEQIAKAAGVPAPLRKWYGSGNLL